MPTSTPGDSAVAAYFDSVRSVLLLDDQFPRFGDDKSASAEGDRAVALWSYCVQRGWLCDIDNAAEWEGGAERDRLAACDLLVLDYHLLGRDARPSLKLLHQLARNASPALVAIYTNEPDLDGVLTGCALAIRGRDDSPPSAELEGIIDDIEDVEWTEDDVKSLLCGGRAWMARYVPASNRVGAGKPNPEFGRAVFEAQLDARGLFVPATSDVRNITLLSREASRWLVCGNLFLAVVGKPSEPGADEAATLFGGLEAAIREWNPDWLTCLVARARRAVEEGLFRDDALELPREQLPTGLALYLLAASDDEQERNRRALEVAGRLLSAGFVSAQRLLADELDSLAAEASAPARGEVLPAMQANAFLSTEPQLRHHVRIGTILRRADGQGYWVCVTPACDMVPRKPTTTGWGADLDPWKPMLGLRVKEAPEADWAQAMEDAERGRHMFFFDGEKTVAAPALNPEPRIEQLFVSGRGVVSDGKVAVIRCVRTNDGKIEMKEVTCTVVAQLRAPYAERLAHLVGGHVSRIGVNFIRWPPRAPEQEAEHLGEPEPSDSGASGEA